MLGDESSTPSASSTTTPATTLRWPGVGSHGARRARLAEPRVGRGRRPDHDRVRRAALLRRLLRRPEARRARARRPARPCSRCTTPRRIGDPRATWGVIDGNPVHDDVRAIAAAHRRRLRARRDPQPRPGDRRRRSAASCSRCTRPPARRPATTRCGPVPRRFDVVVTTNSGYPLDQNLYQAVKGMSAAAAGRPARRHDRLRGRVPRRLPRPRLLPRGAGLRGLAAGAARRDRRRARRPSPTSGRSRSRRPSRPRHASWCTARTCRRPTCARAHLEQTDDVEATVARGAGRRRAGARGCASCRRARRRSRTSPADGWCDAKR